MANPWQVTVERHTGRHGAQDYHSDQNDRDARERTNIDSRDQFVPRPRIGLHTHLDTALASLSYSVWRQA